MWRKAPVSLLMALGPLILLAVLGGVLAGWAGWAPDEPPLALIAPIRGPPARRPCPAPQAVAHYMPAAARAPGRELVAPQSPPPPCPGTASALLGGIARDIPPATVYRLVPALIRLGESFPGGYHILVYENDSPPASRAAFQRALARTRNSTFLFEDGVAAGDEGRAAQMARARNAFLRAAHARHTHRDYLVLLDLDTF